ncbi:hypothetical protein BC830DRAFT_1079468 [Chytriomyces sp. MP71]|nr:hypothetical protein BC830DRAFT_1079468 [Chytriomyces sp. MP71]
MLATSAEYVHTPPGSPGVLSARLLMSGGGSGGGSRSASVANGPPTSSANRALSLSGTDSGSSENEAENDGASEVSSVGGLSAMVVPSISALVSASQQHQLLQQQQQQIHRNTDHENEAENSSPTQLNPVPATSGIARSSSAAALLSQSAPSSNKRFSFFGFGNSVGAGRVSQRSSNVPLPRTEEQLTTLSAPPQQHARANSMNSVPSINVYPPPQPPSSLPPAYQGPSPQRRVTKRSTFDATTSRPGSIGGLVGAARALSATSSNSTVMAGIMDDCRVLRDSFPQWAASIPAPNLIVGGGGGGGYTVAYDKAGRARHIVLNWNDGFNFRLNAELPEAMGSMSSLQILHMNDHRLYGSIPSSFGELYSLRELCLTGNNLSGPLPDALCRLTNLEILDLHDNDFSAPLPLGICRLTKLTILRLNNNSITGSIPEDIGRISGLQQLYLGHNRMEGGIPKSIGKLSKLELLQLQHNKLNGQIPTELGQIKCLKFLFLNSNRFIGELADSMFSNFKHLEYLLLNRNQFSGDIPQSLLNLKQIQILRLDNNYFNPVPREKFPFSVKLGMQLGFKKIVVRPQGAGTPPYMVVPEYSEFPPDVLHPSDHIVAQRNRGSNRLTSLYDLPDNPNRWNPSEVSFFCRYYGANSDVCRSIVDLQMTGGQFFRLQEDDLESALGLWDPSRLLALSNGILPPEYEEGWGAGRDETSTSDIETL